MKTLAAGACLANPGASAPISEYELRRIRAALVVRINAAAEKAKWGREPESAGMPHRLFAAGCYLAAHGLNDFPCAGERWFNTNFIAYGALANAEMIAEGHKAIYEGGCRAIAPALLLEKAA